MSEENYGIEAQVIVPVEGKFFDVDAGLEARNAFADAIAAMGFCDWCFSEGGMHEWTCGFYRITNAARFEKEVAEYLKSVAGVDTARIILRDAESPNGKRARQ